MFSSKTGVRLSVKANLICYITFSFCTPAFVLLLKVIINFILTDSLIGYCGNTCFLPESMAFVFTLIVPIGLICCFNIFFFISTSFTIARRPTLKNDSKVKINQVHFVVYVKLFSITSITLLLQIIDAFVR